MLTPDKAKDPAFLDALQHTSRPDLCITAAYGQFLPTAFLEIPKLGTLNIHPSLLPRWRGASPVQRTLQAGDAGKGASMRWVGKGGGHVDHMPIFILFFMLITCRFSEHANAQRLACRSSSRC